MEIFKHFLLIIFSEVSHSDVYNVLKRTKMVCDLIQKIK